MFLVTPFRGYPQHFYILCVITSLRIDKIVRVRTVRQHLDGHLVEIMWQQKHDNPLKGILNCMAEHFPPS